MLNEQQVAALLGVSVHVLRKWRRHHLGPPWYRIGPSLVRYRSDELSEYVQAGVLKPDSRV